MGKESKSVKELYLEQENARLADRLRLVCDAINKASEEPFGWVYQTKYKGQLRFTKSHDTAKKYLGKPVFNAFQVVKQQIEEMSKV